MIVDFAGGFYLGRSTPIRHSGNEGLFLAAEMSLLSTLAGTPLHVHAEGLRGTGKTTVMRWAREWMPSIARIAGCRYYCDPKDPRCPEHKGGAGFTAEDVPMPFVEIGHGAKLGTILGSIDLTKLTAASNPAAALLPGSIPMANRGVIFIDEVNRLAETAPEVTDVLLSVMGTKPGLVTIEEVGLPPCEVEVSASVWAASNPDEDPGPLEDIRKQLADRFDLVVSVQRPTDPAVVERLLSGKAGGDGDSRAAGGGSSDRRASSAPFVWLTEKASKLPDVIVPPPIVRYISQLYVHRNVESLRAVEALELSGRLLAVMRGGKEVTYDELLVVLPLVLRHRVEPGVLSEILRDLELRRAAGATAKPSVDAPASPTANSDTGTSDTDPGTSRRGRTEPDLQSPRDGTPAPRCGAGSVAGSLQGAGSNACPGSLSDSHSDPRFGTHPSTDTDAQRKRAGWFERLTARYRHNSPPAASSAAGASTGRHSIPSYRNSAEKRDVQRLPDPSALEAVSPPEKARRITSIAWPDLVTPPDWRDRQQ